jgi:hypothetical protein
MLDSFGLNVNTLTLSLPQARLFQALFLVRSDHFNSASTPSPPSCVTYCTPPSVTETYNWDGLLLNLERNLVLLFRFLFLFLFGC